MKNRSLVLLPLRSNDNDINNKGIGYLLEPLLLSDEREELLLLLLVLPEEERLSVCPLETLLRLELLFRVELLLRLELLRFELELPLLRLELLLFLRLEDLLFLSELLFLPEELLSLRLLELTVELLFVRPLSRLEPEVAELPLAGLRPEFDEPEFVSGRRLELPSPLLLFLSGTTSLFGLLFPDGLDGLVEFPGRTATPGRVGALCGRVEEFGRK